MQGGQLRAEVEVNRGGPAELRLVVMTGDPLIAGEISRALPSAAATIARGASELLATVQAAAPDVVLVDGAAPGVSEVLRRLSGHPRRDVMLVALIERGVGAPAGLIDLAIMPPALGGALELVGGGARSGGPLPAPERIMGASLLDGPLEQRLAAAADELAGGFGADRCLISPRGDTTGTTGDQTWTSIEWMEGAARCRASAASEATLVSRHLARDGARPGIASYLAVRLDSPLGNGFIGLVCERPLLFPPSHRTALAQVARRFADELAWRGVHERMVEEVERVSAGPGLDPVLGTWNRAALEQLTAQQLAGASRGRTPLSVAVFDVVSLQSVNTVHGMEAGDALLRRLADAIRAQVREEDVVGRWSGDEIAVVFNRTGPEAARPACQRLMASLRSRPLELPRGGAIAPECTVGIAGAVEGEPAEQLLTRAARAARKAQDSGDLIVGASRTVTPARLSQQLEPAREMASTTLGGAFRLLHEISRGGMGVVYRGEDLALERPVAIKMLRPDLGDGGDLTERFRREAAMLAHLRHPNLVQVYSFGTSGDDSYFVMELVEGESLEQAIDRGLQEGTATSLSEAAVMVEQIGGALDALHERGIIHRDVKPANVILDPFRGRAVLVDVGIAHQYEQPGVVAGTPGYVAPEVVAGGPATPRADVYGLAATVYATLTLRAPFPGDDPLEVIEQQRRSPPQAPSRFRPELAGIDQLLIDGMSIDPARRPESAGAFARAMAASLLELTGTRGELRHREPSGRSPLQRRVGVAEPKTRGVVFRSVARAIGVREAERLRDAVGGEHPELARALSQDTAPLSWLHADLFLRLLQIAPSKVRRDPLRLAGDIARASVRASFRRFFPASSATLVPENTLSAIRSVWARYQSWGSISSMPVQTTEVVVRLTDKPAEPALCAWTAGLLEQLVVLAGGQQVQVNHHECDSRGDRACLFRVSWSRPE